MPCIPRASLLPGERLRMTDHALTLPTGYSIGPMTRAEAGVLGSWAVDEGWNPGLADIDIAWAYDSDAFIALRHHDTLAGGGATLSGDRCGDHQRLAGFGAAAACGQRDAGQRGDPARSRPRAG